MPSSEVFPKQGCSAPVEIDACFFKQHRSLKGKDSAQVRITNSPPLTSNQTILGLIGSHLHTMEQKKRKLSCLVIYRTEDQENTALSSNQNLQLLSTLSICPPSSPQQKLQAKKEFQATKRNIEVPPNRLRKPRGRYHHHPTSGAPVAYAHADAYASAYANEHPSKKRLGTNERSQRIYSRVYTYAYENAHAPQKLVHATAGKAATTHDQSDTQLHLELEDILEDIVGMVEFHGSTYNPAVCTFGSSFTGEDQLGWLYSNSNHFHEQYASYRQK